MAADQPASLDTVLRSARRQKTVASGLYALGLLLAVAGFFGPWIPHKSAALTVTGYELAEFAKFFPQVQGGVIPISRTLFLTPLTACALLLGLFVHQRAHALLWRLVLTGLALLLALATLPPYQFLQAPEYRPQLVLAALGLLLVLLTSLAFRLPEHIVAIAAAGSAAVGLVLPQWQFALTRPLVVDLYDRPIGLGWGMVLCSVGFGLLLASSVLTITHAWRAIQNRRDVHSVSHSSGIDRVLKRKRNP